MIQAPYAYVKCKAPERGFDRPKESVDARKDVGRAVAAGILTRPANCEQCGAEGRVYGHHDSYDRPLDVRWLCPRCHQLAHGKPLAARYFSPRPRRAQNRQYHSRLSGRPYTEALA